MKILAFDVSSTTIGYAILELHNNKTIKYISCDYIKPIKKIPILERLIGTRDKIKQIIEKIQPDQIVIEDIIQYMPGKSTAKTILTLSQFNRMVCLTSYDCIQKLPILYNVMSIRHGIRRASKLTKIPDKYDIPKLLEKILKFKFPFEYKKTGKIREESYDKSDAIAVGAHHLLKLLEK